MTDWNAFEIEVRIRLNTLENIASMLLAKTLADRDDAEIADLHERLLDGITQAPLEERHPQAVAGAVAALDGVVSRVAAYRAQRAGDPTLRG